MRVVWLIGAHPNALHEFENALAGVREKVKFIVRNADSPAEIPESHLSQSGVCMIVDAFHPQYPGFEGVKYLRNKGFSGPLMIMGEPEASSVEAAFQEYALSAFLPPYERLDISFTVGLIYNLFTLTQHADCSAFLINGGRAGSSPLTTTDQFNLFAIKIGSFVAKYGIDQTYFKKILTSLCLAHVREESGGIVLDDAVTVYYGIDKFKLVVACSTYSRGAQLPDIHKEFTQSIVHMKDTEFPGSMFPEFHHVAKTVENMCVFAGSSLMLEESSEPLIVFTAVPFPSFKKSGKSMTFSGFLKVKVTQELNEETAMEKVAIVAPEPATESLLSLALVTDESNPAQAPVTDLEVISPPAQSLAIEPVVIESALGKSGVTTLSLDDVDGLMATSKEEIQAVVAAPPSKIGSINSLGALELGIKEKTQEKPNTPHVAKSVAEMASHLSTHAANAETLEELRISKDEVDRLRDICQSMGNDIKRLMKERREPSTDRELRDAHAFVQEKVKSLTKEKLEMQNNKEKLDLEITVLKAEIEALKKIEKESAAA